MGKIEDFSAGAGHFSFKGTGGAELECETAFAKDSENKMTFDNCDVSGYAKVKGAQYCSDTDELKATFNPLGVPVPVSVKFPKIACPSVVEVVEEQSGCSGTDDFPAYPACYGNNVLGQEDVVLKIEDFSAGAGHFSFKGTGSAELECETAFAKDSKNKMTFDNCDVSGYAKVKGAQYCSDTDELKATFNPLGVPVPVSVKFPKIACPSVVEVVEEQSGCSGTDDFPAYPACYGSNVLGQEDVVLKIEDFSAGAGHFSFKGTGGAELE